MDETLTFSTEEHVEDAFVAYLQSVLPPGVFVGASYSTVEYVEPGVYIGFIDPENVSEDGGFSGHITGMVSVLVRVHADIDSNDALKSSRQQFAELRSRVIYHLAQDNLRELLNANISTHASIDKATIEGRRRTVDVESNAFEAVIMLGVIARPVDA
jgi:GTP cyclohydrolase II